MAAARPRVNNYSYFIAMVRKKFPFLLFWPISIFNTCRVKGPFSMECPLCQNSYKLHVYSINEYTVHNYINACVVHMICRCPIYVNAACIHINVANEVVAYTNAAYTFVYVPGIYKCSMQLHIINAPVTCI